MNGVGVESGAAEEVKMEVGVGRNDPRFFPTSAPGLLRAPSKSLEILFQKSAVELACRPRHDFFIYSGTSIKFRER